MPIQKYCYKLDTIYYEVFVALTNIKNVKEFIRENILYITGHISDKSLLVREQIWNFLEKDPNYKNIINVYSINKCPTTLEGIWAQNEHAPFHEPNRFFMYYNIKKVNENTGESDDIPDKEVPDTQWTEINFKIRTTNTDHLLEEIAKLKSRTIFDIIVDSKDILTNKLEKNEKMMKDICDEFVKNNTDTAEFTKRLQNIHNDSKEIVLKLERLNNVDAKLFE